MLGRQDCGPTRSNSGNAEAAQESMRARMLSGFLQGDRQARLHALPVNVQLAPGWEGESDRIEHARQPGCIQIPLDGSVAAESAVGTVVEALRQWLARVELTAMAILRQLGWNGRDLMQLGGASSCNHALDGVYKTPRGTHPDTSAKAARPSLVADLFKAHIIAETDDLISQFAMQAAAMRGESALRRRQTPASPLITLTLPPHASTLAFASCADAAFLIIVLGIVGTALPLEMSLQPAALAPIGSQFLGEQEQPRRPFPRDNGDGGRSQVESNRSLARQVLGFVQGITFENELCRVHEASAVGSLRLGRGRPMPDQAHILDALLQSVVDHFVFPLDQGRDLVAVPTEPALVAVRTRLHEKAQPRAVGLPLDRVQTSTFATKAHPSSLANTHPIGCLVGAASQLLRHEAVDVLSEPAGTQAFGRLVKAEFGEAVLRAQTSKGLPARVLVGTGNGPGSLPGRVSLHAREAFHRLGKQGIIELSRAFKMSLEMRSLLRVYTQGQGEDKRGGRLLAHAHSK